MPTKTVRAIGNRAKRKTTKHPERSAQSARSGIKSPIGRGEPTTSHQLPAASSQQLKTLEQFTAALAAIKVQFGPYTIAEPDHATAPVAIILPNTIGYCTHCITLRLYADMITVHQCGHCK
jgi:hypothetical protein